MNKLTNGIVFGLAILGGLFIALTVFFAITEDTDVAPTVRDDVEIQSFTPKTPTRNVSDRMGPGSESFFMSGCVPEADESTCQCMYDYLDSNMTNEEFQAFSLSDDMESHPMFNETINNCI